MAYFQVRFVSFRECNDWQRVLICRRQWSQKKRCRNVRVVVQNRSCRSTHLPVYKGSRGESFNGVSSQLILIPNGWTKSKTYWYLSFIHIFQKHCLDKISCISFCLCKNHPNIIPIANEKNGWTTPRWFTKTRQSFRIVSGWIRCTTTNQSRTTREDGLRSHTQMAKDLRF